MPTTVEVKAYTYEELSPKAQENARAWMLRCVQEAGDSSDMISDSFLDLLPDRGFLIDGVGTKSPKIYFSLGYCQGDGMAWTGQVDLAAFLKHHKMVKKYRRLIPKSGPLASYYVKQEGRYYHWNSMHVEMDFDGGDISEARSAELEKLAEELRVVIDETVKDTSREMEKGGYSIIEDSESDERLAEDIKANEHLFTVDGKRSHTL